MNEREVKQLQEYVKKRYDDNNMDYKTFQEEIDLTLTYGEQKEIFDKTLDLFLEKPIPKLKRETNMNIQQFKEKQEEMKRIEEEQQRLKDKERQDKEIEQILNSRTSEELERLYFKPKEYVKSVINGDIGMLLYGKSSLGKSHLVKKTLIELGLREDVDYFILSGHITQLQFYTKLYEYKDKIIIFDDVNILESKSNLNMLKAGLNENSGGRIEYSTSKDIGIPKSFTFKGKVIILLNEVPKNSEHLRAVESRLLVHHLSFSYDEVIKILYEIAKNDTLEINLGVTQKERVEIVNWIKDHTSKATKNMNIRLYQHIMRFYKINKDCWEVLSLGQIQNDEYSEMIIQGISNDDWIEETGLSIRTLKRKRKELGVTRAYKVPK